MDTFFLSHGSPMLAVDESLEASSFFKSWQKKGYCTSRPTSILIISGHWDTKFPTVNVIRGINDTIHDFDGFGFTFPQHMYKLKYPAPGAAELAKRVKELLMESGFEKVDEDEKRGLDHGAWVPLMLMYPEADIPVCQLSLQTDKDATYHYNMGKALAPLTNQGVLIIGSGSATHNLKDYEADALHAASWASEFDAWVQNALVEGRYDDVNDYVKKAPHAKRAHPEPDHLYPLHVAMGAAAAAAAADKPTANAAKLIHRNWEHATLSYASYQFTTPK